jgi:hypothetical protein
MLFHCQSLSLAWKKTLAWTNALAYHGFRNVFIVQAICVEYIKVPFFMSDLMVLPANISLN